MEFFGAAIVVLLVGITLAVLVSSDNDRRAPRSRGDTRGPQSK